jgi:Protein of unknown function (DUF1236)
MKSKILCGALAIALLGSVGIAVAQNSINKMAGEKPGSTMNTPAQLALDDQQKQTIWNILGKSASAKAPSNFRATVGANVPAGIALHPLPSDVASKVPQAKKYHYTKVANEVLLVDPATHKVVDIIKH